MGNGLIAVSGNLGLATVENLDIDTAIRSGSVSGDRVRVQTFSRADADSDVESLVDDASAAALGALAIPFPHRATKMRDADAAEALSNALTKRDLTLDSFRLRGLKKGHFWRGERPALAEVADFAAHEPVPDELKENRFALELSFSLPPGAYATMFVKAAMGG